jgi:hypothetical protein
VRRLEPPHDLLKLEAMSIGLAPDPAEALRRAVTNVAPFVLHGLLTEDDVIRALEDVAIGRGVSREDAATITFARLSALFN